jgi:fucose 4-O-acetylase-like acetyltransferase
MSELTQIVDLFKQLRDDTVTLVREEIVLAKTEATEKIGKFGRNIGFLAAGALTAFTALNFILLATAFLIRGQLVSRDVNEGTATFLGVLIVGVVVGIIAAILIGKAIATLKSSSLTPNKTIRTLKEDKAWVQQKVS